MRTYFYLVCMMTIILTACISSNRHVVGQGSPLAAASKSIAEQIHSKTDIRNRRVQISPNNFWERNTHINLPFSTVLSDTISSELSHRGAVITVQETGREPLKIIGNYQTAQDDVIITATLRQIGDSSSKDLVVVQERISRNDMDPNWLKPEFGRMARTLIRLLEDDYTGGIALRVGTEPFKPGSASQAELMLGIEFEKYVKDALASSPVFKAAGISEHGVSAVLTGEYTVMNSKIVFHTSLEGAEDGKVLAGVSFESDIFNIPDALMLPKNASLDDLAANAADSIIRQYLRKGFSSKGKKTSIYIGKNNFHDMNQKAVIPLSSLLSDKLRTQFARESMFTIREDSARETDLVLSGSFYRDDAFVFINISLDQALKGKTGLRIKTLAKVDEKIGSALCREEWFDMDLRGKIAYLMQNLEKKSLSKIFSNQKSEIVINRFKYENSKEYSKFSDYLDGYILDYFTSSRYFSPVTDLEQRLAEFKHHKKKPVVHTDKTTATLASLAQAEYYVDGTFWPGKDGQVEIKTVLSEVSGRVLASEHVQYTRDLIDPAWFRRTSSQRYMTGLQTISSGETGLSVELLTQKGRNNLSFKTGEEMIFFLKASKTVYVNIFTSDTDNRIFMIYPNRYTGVHPKVRTGEVTLIPDSSYNSRFMFQVRGKTGYEMVFAFASDKPLPRLSAMTDKGIFGMQLVGHDVKDIKDYFTGYTRQNGASLSWDALSIRTY